MHAHISRSRQKVIWRSMIEGEKQEHFEVVLVRKWWLIVFIVRLKWNIQTRNSLSESLDEQYVNVENIL